MNTDLVSVILPVYNGEAYISQAIESCIYQDYTNWELIIVNDLSSDSSPKIAEQYAKLDKRIKVIHNKVNQKLPKTLNVGHQQSNGNYLTWISDDNLFESQFLSEMLKTIKEYKVDFIYSDFTIIDSNGEISEHRNLDSINTILFGNPVQASFLYTREMYQELKGYQEDLFLIEDYDFWLRASIKYTSYHHKKSLYKYRKHDDSLTTDIVNNPKKADQFIKGLEKSYTRLGNDMFSMPTIKALIAAHLGKRLHLSFDHYTIMSNKKIIRDNIEEYEKVAKIQNHFCYIKLNTLLFECFVNSKKTKNLKTAIYLLYFRPKWVFHRRRWQDNIKFFLNHYFRNV